MCTDYRKYVFMFRLKVPSFEYPPPKIRKIAENNRVNIRADAVVACWADRQTGTNSPPCCHGDLLMAIRFSVELKMRVPNLGREEPPISAFAHQCLSLISSPFLFDFRGGLLETQSSVLRQFVVLRVKPTPPPPYPSSLLLCVWTSYNTVLPGSVNILTATASQTLNRKSRRKRKIAHSKSSNVCVAVASFIRSLCPCRKVLT